MLFLKKNLIYNNKKSKHKSNKHTSKYYIIIFFSILLSIVTIITCIYKKYNTSDIANKQKEQSYYSLIMEKVNKVCDNHLEELNKLDKRIMNDMAHNNKIYSIYQKCLECNEFDMDKLICLQNDLSREIYIEHIQHALNDTSIVSNNKKILNKALKELCNNTIIANNRWYYSILNKDNPVYIKLFKNINHYNYTILKAIDIIRHKKHSINVLYKLLEEYNDNRCKIINK